MKLDLGQEVVMNKTNTMIVLNNQLVGEHMSYGCGNSIYRYFDNLFSFFYIRLRTSLIDNI